MIISASYRTDIPAFYGKWFLNRLDAGYCLVENPYSGKPYQVSLTPDDVHGFAFWTKNLAPFMDKLSIVHERGYPFLVQYTITGYPRELENHVVDAERAVQQMHTVAQSYGPRVAVWRYDGVIFTSLTDLDFHRRNFARLAQMLAGATDEVDISFLQIHRKTRRNMDAAARLHGFTWHDPDDETKLDLVAEFVEIARANGMQLNLCSQPQYAQHGAGVAHCIDARRLGDVAGKPIVAKVKGNRPDCGCYMARDIGAYDTCPHGCVYCYAVRNRALALRHYKSHDPRSPFLFANERNASQLATESELDEAAPQPRLF